MSFVNLYVEIEQYLGAAKYKTETILLSSEPIELYDNTHDIQTTLYLKDVLDKNIKTVEYNQETDEIIFTTDMFGVEDEEIRFKANEVVQENIQEETREYLLNHINLWMHDICLISYDITEQQLSLDNSQKKCIKQQL